MNYDFAELDKYLNDREYIDVLNLCINPKSWNELNKETKRMKIKQSKIFQILKDLKNIKALEFKDRKYYTPDHIGAYLKERNLL